MADEFDMAEALDSIASDLGFDKKEDALQDLELEQKPDASPDGEVKADVKVDADTKIDTDVKAKADIDTKSDAKANADAKAKPDVDAKAKADAEKDAGPPPPKTWRPDAAKDWGTLPKVVKDEILKREEDMFRGIESYKATASIGKAFSDVLQPYMKTYEEHNVNPLKQVQELLHAHHVLSFAPPEAKVEVFKKLAESYGVQISSDNGIMSLDPQLAEMQTTIRRLENKLQQGETRVVDNERAKLAAEIDTFASNPANIYFDEVAADIPGLLRSGTAKSLADAYEKAVWANPVTRAKEQLRLSTAQQAEAKKLEDERAQAARKAAAVNVKLNGKQGHGTMSSVGSMDDTLKETLANIQSRS